MTNLEKYKDEIKNYLGRERVMCKVAELRGEDNCDSILCKNCQLESLKWLSKYYQEPKIKLTNMEYDLLKALYGRLCFDNYSFLSNLHNKGYFKGVTDISMEIEDILANCGVVENVD